VCVCVCVREREREKKTRRKIELINGNCQLKTRKRFGEYQLLSFDTDNLSQYPRSEVCIVGYSV
jgi:hypothetical protein